MPHVGAVDDRIIGWLHWQQRAAWLLPVIL
jgi:hypothetical protein